MEKIKFDLKDKRILDELDQDANIPLSRLAKKVGISSQVAEYRVKRLISQGTIWGFFTLVDPSKRGYSLFRVHLQLKNVKEEVYASFARRLFKDYPTFWVAFVSGSFDIIIDIWSLNIDTFNTLFREILEKNSDIIKSYEIIPILELSLFEYGYFLKEKNIRDKITLFRNFENIKIDEKDKRILHTIKNNSRQSFEAIGNHVGLTRNAVKYRIKDLEKRKVIAEYKMMVRFQHFDRTTYKILIRYDSSKIDQEKSLLDCLKNRSGILSYTKLLSRWNLDIEIEPKDVKELQVFLIALRNKFDIIDNYELVQVIEDYGIDFFPNTL
mgnify:CR=1 FL=1